MKSSWIIAIVITFALIIFIFPFLLPYTLLLAAVYYLWKTSHPKHHNKDLFMNMLSKNQMGIIKKVIFLLAVVYVIWELFVAPERLARVGLLSILRVFG